MPIAAQGVQPFVALKLPGQPTFQRRLLQKTLKTRIEGAVAGSNNRNNHFQLARLQQSFDNRASAEDRAKAQKLLISDKFSKLAETKDQEDANICFVNALWHFVHNYPETIASEFICRANQVNDTTKAKVQVLLSQIDVLSPLRSMRFSTTPSSKSWRRCGAVWRIWPSHQLVQNDLHRHVERKKRRSARRFREQLKLDIQ